MIVVDANIIAYRAIEGQKTALAIPQKMLDNAAISGQTRFLFQN